VKGVKEKEVKTQRFAQVAKAKRWSLSLQCSVLVCIRNPKDLVEIVEEKG
jgi:hypothetical protein